MAYFAPFIDASGLHIPTYTDIRDQLVADAKTIFGADIYLGIDSQDYQWISSVASIIYDSFLTSQSVYNSRGPSTAIGSGLDVIVKINGIKRLPAVYSTCYVTLTGTAGTMITNGVIGDTAGNLWSLSSPVTISSNGQATAFATCQKPGPIVANPGELNKIVTPTYGWTSVTNAAAASLGALAETDAVLRSRQSISTAQPSRTVLEGIKGAIAAVPGVARFEVYENDTNVVDANGLPPHSVTAVVEGGVDGDIARAIFNKKGPGCYTNGSTPVDITDQYGVAVTIRFDRPIYVDIDVVLNVKQLAGYTTDTTASIKSNVAAYIGSLTIGDDLSISSLWGAALTANSVPTKPLFSITGLTAAKQGDPQGTADIITAFNEVTCGNIANVTVNVT
ncbi:baseplate J/gp47 family protein [Paenibacillus sp. GCM10012303]|uniref:baseplate J/gp47 family protein n=1 Tax=Paenibacillus sp. GCM10012303 TaxID=3317340 RepID=UPI00360951BF